MAVKIHIDYLIINISLSSSHYQHNLSCSLMPQSLNMVNSTPYFSPFKQYHRNQVNQVTQVDRKYCQKIINGVTRKTTISLSFIRLDFFLLLIQHLYWSYLSSQST